MALKRYFPKYKILAKIKQPLWLEKRSKIAKFNRQKWEGKKKTYFPKKRKVFDQDSSTYGVGIDFDSDRLTRLKKTYKQVLQYKQLFQLYYGERRLRLYQLKHISLLAKGWGQKKKIPSSRLLFHLMENRLEVCLYRLGLVNSLMQSRKLLTMSRIKVNSKYVKNSGFSLKQGDFVMVEPLKSMEILGRYLKFNVPFYYFRKKLDCKETLLNRKKFYSIPVLEREKKAFFSYLKKTFSLLEKIKK